MDAGSELRRVSRIVGVRGKYGYKISRSIKFVDEYWDAWAIVTGEALEPHARDISPFTCMYIT